MRAIGHANQNHARLISPTKGPQTFRGVVGFLQLRLRSRRRNGKWANIIHKRET